MNKAVLILDLDKLSTEEWKDLWHKSGLHIAKIHYTSEPLVIEALDKIQEEELVRFKK